jgi:hypothetical protein
VAAVLLSNYNIKVIAAVGKPDMIIDNEKIRFRRKLKKRVILPEEFLNLP